VYICTTASQIKTVKVQEKTPLCAAVGIANYHHRLDACTVYGRNGSTLKNVSAALNLSVLISWQKIFKFSI
jgi:hypothetical protein